MGLASRANVDYAMVEWENVRLLQNWLMRSSGVSPVRRSVLRQSLREEMLMLRAVRRQTTVKRGSKFKPLETIRTLALSFLHGQVGRQATRALSHQSL